jgi:hypothetical protein
MGCPLYEPPPLVIFLEEVGNRLEWSYIFGRRVSKYGGVHMGPAVCEAPPLAENDNQYQYGKIP